MTAAEWKSNLRKLANHSWGWKNYTLFTTENCILAFIYMYSINLCRYLACTRHGACPGSTELNNTQSLMVAHVDKKPNSYHVL